MVSRLLYADDPGNPWVSLQYLQDNSATVLAALREHVLLTGQSVVLAALVALPLAVAAFWSRRLTGPILAVSGALYTIPSLALFAFVAPYVGTVVADRIRDEATDDWDDQVAVDRLVGKGATFVRGTGRLTGPGVVDVGGTAYRATTGVVVATGSTPAVPPVDGLDTVPFWTNHDAVEARELPASLLVLGGGAIGCELAQVLARFGVRVTVVEGAGHLIPAEEPEAAEILAQVLGAEGVVVRTGVKVERAEREGDGVALVLAGGERLAAEKLLVATGRRADPRAAGLDAVGVAADARTAPVDERCRVADGVWAIGDITGKGAFTHVSMYQANIVIRDLLGQGGPPADYRALPRVTFTDPEVGAVGMTERQARDALTSVQVGTATVASTARGWIHKTGNEGVIKLVADPERGVLVGATTMGPSGGEVIGALAVAVHAEVPLDTLRSMIYAYPTFHRGIEDALRDLG
jgi:pyruvate/2-oxoglutarate dehydrogenase complex dihydrolipoamide dehydrogenase (E3) component